MEPEPLRQSGTMAALEEGSTDADEKVDARVELNEHKEHAAVASHDPSLIHGENVTPKTCLCRPPFPRNIYVRHFLLTAVPIRRANTAKINGESQSWLPAPTEQQ